MPKKILKKKPVTLAEAAELLQQRSEESELSYWQRVALEHAIQNSPLPAEVSREIVNTLIERFELTELSAFSIVNTLPTMPEELKDLLQKEPKMLTESDIAEIFEYLLGYIQKYVEQR
ncbi:MAG: RNA polymerase Rpb4 family protein [Candidatus Heimdallarchaeaceae archaeon]